MRRCKQDYWMSCSIVLKDTKQNASRTTSGNKKTATCISVAG
ncbi:hypothetical protein HMPREF9547_00039 [Escherichia coli MS 175-1]|nr:hypothetical protein HMPREF9547_00039 [Escherichia coli MS 175-1]